MEQQYFNNSSATGLATTVVLLTVSLLPSAIYPIRIDEKNKYKQYINSETQNYNAINLHREENGSQKLISFAQMMLDNSKEDDPEIAKITNDGFWEFHENF